MTSSTEVVTDLARHPSDRRKSLQSGGGRHKGTRSEPEDTSDSEERESAFQNEELMPELRVLRGRTAAVPQAPSSDKKSPQASPSKKRADEIYPGLLNITAPMLAPKTAPAPQAPSKISQRTPTPPRFSSIHRVEPPSSYSTSSSIFKSTPTAPSTTGAVTDLTTLYLSQSRDRPAFTATCDPFGTGRRIVQQEEQEEYEDEEMEGEDDGHMESSRELPSSGFTNHYLLPAPPRSSVKRVSILAAISKIPSRAIAALTAPFKSSPKSVGHYDRRQTYGLGGAYAGAARGRSDISARGVDVSRLLLYSLTLLFAFLLLAYLATVHTQIFINAGRIASNAAMETAIFLYAYAILPTIIIAIIISVCMGAYFVNQRWHAAQAEEKRAVFDLIEKITDIIRDSSEQGQAYVAEPHVRDMLIPPSKRLRDSPEWRRWQQAVSFINLNESRVSTESRIINGVECAVWRWLPAKKTGWQGNAFDGQSQLNVPDHALSHCLKLRGMFPSTQSADRDGADVKRALLQKLSPIRPLHVHVEEGSKEGVVFARFATFSDCKDAFTALHGTWFNGQLVSAKYLRDERYEQRFPDAKRQ
ncbi:Inner nuclear membrane protein Man1 [Toxocara canis]|uniref:Inner nuclear membrane protein Man1 n=1 Tax=Toxocara canis TaxID=6265 RepID=A0A0B2VIV1_TOXCA|nr:Inner nuclear membrane protein Man1 [Toxocara canis]